MAIFLGVILLLNFPVLAGRCFRSLMFEPGSVAGGQWWRVLTHPFIHVTWYHLLLDGTAFMSLYASLIEPRVFRRLIYVAAGATGSLVLSAATAIPGSGFSLCGLSGIAHGLMAVSAIEMITSQGADAVERRIGWITLVMVVGKAAIEAVTGHMFFAFLDFGLLGSPVAVSHAGGIVGSLLAMLGFSLSSRRQSKTGISTNYCRCRKVSPGFAHSEA
jgi:rhomboid family GlyGly-CTERM serine protease